MKKHSYKDNHFNERRIIRVVVLTKSGKNKGACVSGFDLQTHKFVRFVRDAETASAIPFNEIYGIAPFDIVEVENGVECPLGPQSENILVNHMGIKRIIRYTGTIEDIRKNVKYSDNNSFMKDVNNRLFDVSSYHHSLEIVSVQNLVLTKHKFHEKITTRASFSSEGKYYSDFRVTDFSYDMRKIEEDRVTVPYADLIISIPKDEFIYQGERKGYYKFVSAIYPIEKPYKEFAENYHVIDSNNGISGGRQNDRNQDKESRTFNNELWTETEDIVLIEDFNSRLSFHDIAVKHKRSSRAIISRLKELGKII